MSFKDIARKWALYNKYKYGKLDLNSVVSKVVYEYPEIKGRIKEVINEIKNIVEEVDKLSKEECFDILKREFPELLEERKKEEKKELKEFNIYKTNTRFAPNPSGYLHIGHARAIVLSYYYAKKYNGKFILRLEDTDPKVKKPMIEVYDKIKEDVEWLINDKVDEFYIQSERLEIYYEHIKKLIEKGFAYIDLSDQKTISKLRKEGIESEYRNKGIEWNIEQFYKMINGEYDEGQAVIRIKTDMVHPNPSVRDWIAFRIINPKKNPHPWLLYKYGENYAEKFFLWPTYNFSVSIDDHLMGIKLILRMKEHEVNTIKQSYIYEYFGWEKPIVVNYGALLVKGMPLHKSEIRKLMSEGKISGWDDPFLPTLRGLKRRGISNEAIKKYILEMGVTLVDAVVDWEKIYRFNREIYDKNAKRYFIVKNPIKLIVEGMKEKSIKIRYHPKENLGEKDYIIKNNVFYIEKDDLKYRYVRLMDLFNVEIYKVENDFAIGRYISDNLEDIKKLNGGIIQWINEDYKTKIKVWERDGIKECLAESYINDVKDGEIIHGIRFGFLKREKDRFIFVHK